MKFSTRWLAMAGCIHDFNVDIHLVSRIGLQAVRQGLL